MSIFSDVQWDHCDLGDDGCDETDEYDGCVYS